MRGADDVIAFEGGWEAIGRGLSAAGGATDNCFTNFRTVQQLASFVGKSEYGLKVLNKAARRCEGAEFKSGEELLQWGGINIFFMAEGNYPFPSLYIPLSMGIDVPFPAWPMRVGCAAGLNADLGVKIDGSLPDVKYTVEMGAYKLNIDWAAIAGNGANVSKEEVDASKVFDLIRGYVDFNGVLANITGKHVGDHSCYGNDEDDLLQQQLTDHFRSRVGKAAAQPDDAGNDGGGASSAGGAAGPASAAETASDVCPPCPGCVPCPASTRDGGANAKPRVCNGTSAPPGSWGLITCNDMVDMSAVKVKGVGRDAFWPPSVNGKPESRGWSAATIKGPVDRTIHPTCTAGFDSNGYFGGPQKAHSWGDWISEYYHEVNQSAYTNIVWSNGALDPWSGGGHYLDPAKGVMGAALQNLTEDGSSVALAIQLGGHHLDLYFPTPGDPPTVQYARKVEAAMIRAWCQKHYDGLV